MCALLRTLLLLVSPQGQTTAEAKRLVVGHLSVLFLLHLLRVHVPEAKGAGSLLLLDFVGGPARFVFLPEQIDLMNRSLKVRITRVGYGVKISDVQFVTLSYLGVLVMA